jgi:hypothetical protein
MSGPSDRAPYSRPVIVMFAQSAWAGLYSPMARALRAAHDIDSVLVAPHERRLPNSCLFDFDRRDFREIILWEKMTQPRREAEVGSAASVAERAAELERRLGVDPLQILRGDRILGLDFVVGATFHDAPLGRASFLQRLDIVLRLCEAAEALLLRLRPLAIIAYPGSVHTNALVSVGETLGAPMRALWPPRRENYFVWIADRWGRPRNFQRDFADELKRARSEPEGTSGGTANVALGTPTRVTILRERFRAQATVRALAGRLARQLRKGLPARLRGRGIDYGEYYLAAKLRQTLEVWGWQRRALREPTVLGSLPADLPFVFFPLHMEPEVTTLVEASAADTQITCIDWLAKTAPAGWHVVVKEHPAQASLRRPGFWEQVRRYPNVIVASTLESAEAIIPRARAVAVINSTVGFQAAMLGLPVLTFHAQYLPRVLPHVWFADSYEGTRCALREIRDGAGPDMAVRQAAIRAFMRTLARSEFAITDPDMLAGRPTRKPLPKEEFERLVEKLLESLADRLPAAAAAAE